MIRRSSNGISFAEPVRVNDVNGDATVRNENPPKIAFSEGGDVYVCWANERERWKGNIRFARSTDQGRSFSRSITINSDGAAAPAGHAFQSMAVDRNGVIHIAWIDERNKRSTDRGAEIWLSSSSDGGRTFSNNRKILADVCECCRTSFQVDSRGRLFVAYRTVPRKGAMYRDVVVASSTNGGRTFRSSIVSRDGWEINACPVAGPALNVDRNNRLTVFWFTGGGAKPGLYYASSESGQLNFSPGKLVDPEQKAAKRAHASSQANNLIAVAWDDVANNPIVRWGLLDSVTQRVDKRGSEEFAALPVVAAANGIAVIAAARTSSPEIFVKTLHLKAKE
jgi:hypothetical protein